MSTNRIKEKYSNQLQKIHPIAIIVARQNHITEKCYVDKKIDHQKESKFSKKCQEQNIREGEEH